MTSFDLFVVVLVLASLAFGWLRGLTREAITLLALAGGFGMVAGLATPVSSSLSEGLTGPIVAILLLFAIGFLVVTVALEALARRLIGRVPRRPDRLAGLAFGAVRGWLLCGLSWLAVSLYFAGEPLPDVLEEAALGGPASAAAGVLSGLGLDGAAPRDESADDLDAL